MHTIDERSADIPRSPHDNGAAAPDPFREATDRLRAEFGVTYTAIRRFLYIERQALGLSLFEGAFRVGTFVCLGLTGFALAITAALLLVTSTRRGLALWTNGAWWSDLVLALALGIGIVTVAHMVRRYVHRSVLARTRRELDARPIPVAPGPTRPEIAT